MLFLLLSACSETGLNKDAPDAMCPAYSGFHAVGQTWTWNVAGAPGTMLYTLTGVVGNRLTVELYSESTTEDSSQTLRRESTWRCDEAGAWLVEEVNEVHAESYGAYAYVMDDVSTFTYAPDGWLVVPAGLASASTWEVDFSFEVSSTLTGESTQRWMGTYFAENEEVVETPAGTFNTMEINGAGEIIDDASIFWYDHDYRDAEVGLVLDETIASLTAWTE